MLVTVSELDGVGLVAIPLALRELLSDFLQLHAHRPQGAVGLVAIPLALRELLSGFTAMQQITRWGMSQSL